jgi:hypothetical protein
MTPSEVHGLQSLAMAHGGSLTINPHTGLPEAGFLSSILPMVAGFALAPLTAGTSLAFLGATPFASALTVGGLTALTSGSLKKGLMAGLGAYGGAGLGSSFAGASEEGLAAQEAAKNTALEAAKNTATSTAAAASTPSAMVNASGELTKANLAQQLGHFTDYDAAGNIINGTAAPVVQAAGQTTAAVAPTLSKEVLAKVAEEAAAKVPITGANLMSGASNVFSKSDALGAFAKAHMGQIGMAAAPMLEGLMEQPTLSGVPAGSPGMIRPYTYEPNYTGADKLNNQTVYNEETGLPDSSVKNYSNPVFTALTPYRAPGPEYKDGAYGATAGLTGSMAGLSPEQVESLKRTYPGLYENIGSGRTINAADGGLMGGPVEQMDNANAIGANTGYPMANLPTMAGSTGTAVDPFSGQQTFAGGGEISDLGSYSDGGRLLRGPGTGLSDNIPAQIGARQPARLADGEFVIPADVVSAMGGGSTDAGAKKFYAMLDRVRQQAHGSKKQVRKISDRAVMPA